MRKTTRTNLGRKEVLPVEKRPVKYQDSPEFPVGVLPPALRDLIDNVNLDPAMLVAFGLAAMATAANGSELFVGDAARAIRTIFWLTAIAESSDGKSPALWHARQKLKEIEDAIRRERQEAIDAGADEDEMPLNYRVVGSVTPEAMVRLLAQFGRRTIFRDELSTFLSSVGAYKPEAKDGDWGFWMELWTGSVDTYVRVGRGGKKNEIELHIDDPVVTVAGCLTSADLATLGDKNRGSLQRWLPFRCRHQAGRRGTDGEHKIYDAAIERAYFAEPITWRLRGAALRVWDHQCDAWEEQRGEEPHPFVQAALGKANDQVLRLALVLSEFTENDDAEVTSETMRAAIAIMKYVLDVWRSFETYDNLTFSLADEKAWRAAQAIHQAAVAHGGELRSREITSNRIGKIRNAATLKEVREIYEQNWVVEERKPKRGGRTTVVYTANPVDGAE